MLTVGDNLSSITLGAGEPLLLQVAFQEADGSPSDLSHRAFVLAFYKAPRASLVTIEGVLSDDGTFLRFEVDGSFSESMYGKVVSFELDERFRNSRNRIASGALTVQADAAAIDSYDAGPIGDFAVRVVYKETDAIGAKLAFSQSIVAYLPPDATSTPTPAPTATTRPTIVSDGTPQVGEQLTGQSGTYSNGSVIGRAWLLGGTAISGANGATYVPQQTGSLVYRETVDGPGGEITSDSDAVTIAATHVSSGPTGFALNGSTNTVLKQMISRVSTAKGRGRIVVKGDSTTVGDGGGNTSRGDGARRNRWPTIMAARLTSAGSPTIDLALVGSNNIQSGGTSISGYDTRVSLGAGTPWYINGTGAANATISQQFAGGSWLTSGAIAVSATANTYPLTMASPSYDTTGEKFGSGALSAGYGRRPDGDTIVTSATSFTVDVWFKGTGSGLQVIQQLSPVLWMGMNNGKPFYGIGNAAGDHASGTATINDGSWHHGRICSDSTSLRFYCDGTLQATAAALSTLVPPNGAAAFAVRSYLSDHTYDFTGEVDQTAVFSTVLTTDSTYTVPSSPYAGTEANLLALYNFDNSGVDASGNSTLSNCLTLTEVCDRFEVVIYDTTANSGIAFWLDGVSVVATGNPSQNTANSGGFKTFTIAASAVGTHTLAIGATAGQVDLRSIRPYTSSSPSIDVVVQASCAAVSGDQAYTNGQNRNQESLALDAPDLTIIMLGFNDANTGVAASTFQANLASIIDKAKVTGDVLLVGTYMASGGFESSTLRAAAGAVASSKSVAYMDLNAFYGGVIPPNMYDQVHRTAAGYADMGSIVQQAVAAMVSS